MATKIEDIGDLFMMLQQDPRLVEIYNTSGSLALNTFIESWLLYSIQEFNMCEQALTYSTSTQEFSVDLTQENQLILAQIMIKYWLQKTVQDVRQMNIYIQDKDFKTHSSAQNLKEKESAYDKKREEISFILQDYVMRKTISNDWTDWLSGNYMGA